MAGLYDSVSGQGILNAIGNNPVGRWVQSKYPESQLKHDVGGAIVSARNALTGTDAGAIPVPQEQADKNVQDRVGALQSDVQGMLAPTDPAHNPAESASAPTTDPNSQQAGADAKAAQDSAMNQTKQQVADDTTKGGGVPTPITTDNPAQSLAARNQNIQAGVGHPITGANQPDVPKPLTDNQQKNVTLHEAGQETFKSMNTIGDWFQSKSFLMGMMQTGMSLLDGKGYAESFAAGSNYFDKHYGMEQRQAWADDLLQKGYDRQEIQQYIETGDAKTLTSPEQRAMQQLQQQNQLQQQQLGIQVGQQNLEKAQYENSPEMRNLDIQERQNKMQYNQAMMEQMRNNMALKQQEAPIRLQTLQQNAQTAQMKATAAAAKAQGMNAHVVQGANGAQIPVSPYKIGDYNVMLNSRGNPIINSKGVATVYDPKTGQTFAINTNKQATEAALSSVNRSLRLINNFDIGGGTKLFGPTGEFSRSFGDFWGQRSSADFKSKINTLQNSLHSAALAKVEMESQGNAVREGQLKAEVESLGKLTDEHGQPLDISQEQAANIIQGYRDYLGFVGQSSEAQAANAPEQVTQNAVQNRVAAGTVSPDGKWRAAKSGDQYDRSIWVPNQ